MSDMTIQNAIHCMKAMICEEVCEDCDYYGKTGTDHCEADAVRMAIKALEEQPERPEQPESAKEYCAECNHIEMCRWYPYEGCEFRSLPSAQPERDIPIKPKETTDKAWGIPARQAVCPKCDYYLGHIAFLGDYKGKRITYCETCGQAIDWEGWEFEE